MLDTLVMLHPKYGKADLPERAFGTLQRRQILFALSREEYCCFF